MSEEWKWIDGYEGIYMVSDLGRLKSFRKNQEGYILSNRNQKGDYLKVNLYDRERNRETKGIHVLVASAFIGQIPSGWHVHHMDGNKQNNAVTNLKIVHPKKHRLETKRAHPQIVDGMVNYNRYVRTRSVRQYTMDGDLLASYPNAMEASRATGVCKRNILQVASGTPYNAKGKTRKQAGGYVWRFAEKRDGDVK